jgi:tetratricopeptide (TPR) repeat protein
LKLRGCLLFTAALAGAVVLFPTASRAQHHHDSNGGAAATLRPDLGSLDHPIATTSPEVQKFFDQGLTLVYAFNHGEAVRSFRRAAELDPKSPMPYWGIALALGPNYNETNPQDEKAPYEAIRRAKQLAADAPEAERAYVDALALRFTSDAKPDYDRLARDYSAAMRELSHRYRDDPDAGTLYAESLMDLHAWGLWTSDGKPAENTLEIVSTLESVLRRWPDHCGANHFYIHAMEMAPNPERALPSARRLQTLVPGAGHLVHMPSHIYIRTGDYSAAVKSNQQAVAVDNQMPAPPGGNMTYMIYRAHNVHFLAAAAMMDGEFEVATAAAKDLASRANTIVADMPMAEAFLPYQLFVQLRFQRWDNVLAAPPAAEGLNGLAFFAHYARGVAFAAEGHAPEAEAERAAMERAYKKLPAGPAFAMSYNDWSTIHDMAAHTLAARIGAAQGDQAGAIEQWRAAVAVQDKMNYNEPADWYYPVRESLGAALLASGKAAEAETVFRQDLERNPRNPRSLFGLWRALEAQNKTVDAGWVRASFEAVWKGAPDQPRLADF